MGWVFCLFLIQLLHVVPMGMVCVLSVRALRI